MEAIDLPIDDDDRLAEPPLVDSLHIEDSAAGYSVTFVPSAGEDPTCFAFIPFDTTEGRLIKAYLLDVEHLVGGRVIRIVHSGGGDYGIVLDSGQRISLSDEASDQDWATDVFDRLHQIAVAAELAYKIEQLARR